MKKKRIVLVGDSVFDNEVYVKPYKDVISHLERLLPENYAANLCAVDGSTTLDIVDQIRYIPKSATHIFVSIGGNDVLPHRGMLYDDELDRIDILEQLARKANTFHRNYTKAINLILKLGKPVTLFTIYNGYMLPEIATAIKAAVAIFNDKIYQVANKKNLSVIELRDICKHAADFANPIEPSSIGGIRIAKAIYNHVKKARKKNKKSDIFLDYSCRCGV